MGVTEQMVEKALNSMKAGKTPGAIWGYKAPYKGCRSSWGERAFSGL